MAPTSPRSPSDAIDLGFYASHKQVSRDMATGRYANFYQHLLLVGLDAGLPLKRPVRPDFALPEAEARNAFLNAARRMLPDIGRHQLDFTVPEEGAAVSVITVLRNQFALTMQCLASLRSSFPGGIELILVDNASSDDTAAIPDLVRGAKIIRCDANLGFLRACNLALDCVTAPSVLYLNNDVVLGSHSVALALARLESDESVGAVGGKVVRTHGLLQEAGCILWRDDSAEGWLRDAVPDAPEANFVRDVDFCSGCFLMVRADLLAQLGGFDDAFAPGLLRGGGSVPPYPGHRIPRRLRPGHHADPPRICIVPQRPGGDGADGGQPRNAAAAARRCAAATPDGPPRRRRRRRRSIPAGGACCSSRTRRRCTGSAPAMAARRTCWRLWWRPDGRRRCSRWCR